MMPAALSASLTYSTGAAVHTKDGLSTNFNSAATVNTPAACTVMRMGCMSPTALNYDQYATVNDGTCLEPKSGCLNPNALNFGCSSSVGLTSCTETPPVTVHNKLLCRYYNYPPPSPPPPTSPPLSPVSGTLATTTSYNMAISLTAAGAVSDYDAAKQTAIKQAFADAVPTITISDIVLTISAASVNLDVQIKNFASAATMQTSVDFFKANFTNAEQASKFFAAAGVAVSVEVVQTIAPQVITTYLPLPPQAPPPSPPSSSNIGGMVGGIVGGLTGLCGGIGGAYWYMQKKKKEVAPS